MSSFRTPLTTLLDPRTPITDLRILLAGSQGSGLDWEALVIEASDLLVTTNLHSTLVERNVLDEVPDNWRSVLELIVSTNGDRNLRMLSQFEALCSVLNQIGIEPVALKGVALLLEKDYPLLSTRIVGDIDVLLLPEQISPALEALRDQGYQQLSNAFDPRNRHEQQATLAPIDVDDFRNLPDWSRYHVPPVFSGDAEFAMELHSGVCPAGAPLRAALDALCTTRVAARQRGNARYGMPSIEARLAHNFHHSFITDEYHARATVDWRHLIDAARLWERRESATLTTLCQLMQDHGLQDAFAVHLWQARELMGVPSLEPGIDNPRARRAIDTFCRRSANPAYLTRVRRLSRWRPRLANLVSAARLRRLYGPVPMPVAMAKYLRWCCLQWLKRRNSRHRV